MKAETKSAASSIRLRFELVSSEDRLIIMPSHTDDITTVDALLSTDRFGFILHKGAPEALITAWKPGHSVTITDIVQTTIENDPELASLSAFMEQDNRDSVKEPRTRALSRDERMAWLREKAAARAHHANVGDLSDVLNCATLARDR